MLILGPVGFATPWLLAAMAALPVLWLILRAMPPAPRRLAFPGVRLLQGLRDRSPVAQRTPWWLLLLRMLAIGLLILAFAAPVWKPVVIAPSQGPLLVIVDAGWAAAPDWSARQTRAERALSDAATAGRPAALLLADGRSGDAPLTFAPASQLISGLKGAAPASWTSRLPFDPAVALSGAPPGTLSTLWIADGQDHAARADWLAALITRGVVQVVPPARSTHALSLAEGATPSLTLHGTDALARGVLAIGPDPTGTERELARLTPGDPSTEAGITRRAVAIDLPPELRNRITRFQIDGEAHAGAVVLADDRVRRRKVGLVGDAASSAEGQQLLSPLHYLRQALAPTSDLVEGGLADVLNAAPDVIVLADQIGMAESEDLTAWVDEGGMLIRFGGPRMAASDRLAQDPLLPVRLRPGGRDIGGALSWGDPRGLRAFAGDGLFAGLTSPDDVAIRAQLMAEPSPELSERTVAALSDNTPLITRAARGQGQIILFHVTANAEWSNLPISGLFVQMLDRLIASARASVPDQAQTEDEAQPYWTAELVLDGFGRNQSGEDIAPIAAAEFAQGPSPGQPAGLYRAGERQAALNAGGPLTLADWPGALVENAAQTPGRDLKPHLIVLAALLLALDALGSALLSRGMRLQRAGNGAAIVLIAALMALTSPDRLHAQTNLAPPTSAAPTAEIDAETIRAADEVALAYVLTGDETVDRITEQGLSGLSRVTMLRTSVEPGAPVGIDLDRNDLSVLTFLYWPVTEGQPTPSPAAYVRLNHFLRTGGMILFDTGDGDLTGVGGPDMGGTLQALAAPLDIPPLAPIPDDHVLTRSFYLLDDFPGRWQGNEIWAEAPPAGAELLEGQPFRMLNDGVSPVIIGGNSWAEAWALDERGVPVLPVGSGFEGERQREIAFRFGINLIMYVLTGNYKSDQVHVPALLDRLREESGGIEVMP